MPNDLNSWDELISTYSGLRNIVYALDGCQNKRVVHLVLHGKKKTRKKNWKRAMKIMNKGVES